MFKQLADAIEASIKIYKRLTGAKDKKAYAKAIIAIQRAVNKTRLFINSEGYITNDELSDIWLEAMQKVTIADLKDDLSIFLLEKSRFWNNPQAWLASPETLKLVPQLSNLEQECEMILLQTK